MHDTSKTNSSQIELFNNFGYIFLFFSLVSVKKQNIQDMYKKNYFKKCNFFFLKELSKDQQELSAVVNELHSQEED